MTGTVTRLQTRARIRSDFLAQSPADHRLLVDERVRLHEGWEDSTEPLTQSDIDSFAFWWALWWVVPAMSLVVAGIFIYVGVRFG